MNAWIDRVFPFSAKDARFYSRCAMLIAVGVLGLLISVALWRMAHRYEEERLVSEFQRRAEQYVRELNEEIHLQAQHLRALRNLFLFSRKVTRAEFAGAAREVLHEFPALQTLQWVVRVPGKDRRLFEERVRKEGLPQFQIHERGPDGILVPAPDYPDYLVVDFVEPMAGNEAVIGFNAGTGWTQKEFAHARDTGQVVGSSAIYPVVQTHGQLATVLICPVYVVPLSEASETERRVNQLGFLQAVLRLPALFEQAWKDVKSPGLDVMVTDHTPGAKYTLLHASGAGRQPSSAGEFNTKAFYEGLYREVSITSLGRDWRLLIQASPAWIHANTAWAPVMILIGGLLFTVLSLIYLNTLARRTETIQTIVEQRTSELKQSRERLRLALEAAEMGTWDWDIASGKLTSSGTLEKIHGIAVDTFAGLAGQFIERVHPEDRDCFREAINRAIRHNEAWHIQIRSVCLNGSIRWLAIDGRLLRDTPLKTPWMVGVVRDVTDRKNAEDALHAALTREQKSREEAEAANHAKDQFLAALSHELRTPLTPVVALLPTLLELESLPEEIRDDLLLIKRNVDLETRLIDDLLDVTRITKGRFHLNLQKTNAHVLIGQTMQIVRGDAAAKQIPLIQELEAANPCTWGDPTRLQQVLWNVVKNAVKFTAAGGSIWIRTRNPESGTLEIEVTDTGIGIHPAKLPDIFGAFAQSSPMHSHRFGGLGLGLFISRAIVQQHGGTIEAESRGEGRGSTFRIQFKTTESVDCEAEPQQLGEPIGEQGLRILLVEDHHHTRQVLERLLRKRGYSVMAADCVKTAMELAEAHEVDLIVSDIGLPDGNGLDLMSQLKERYALRGIALSGFGMEEDLRKSREVGFAAHLTKPVEFRELERALRELASNA